MAQAPLPHGEVFWEEVLELGLAKVAEGGETTVENESLKLPGAWHTMEGHMAGTSGSAKLVRLMPSAPPSHMLFATAASHLLIFNNRAWCHQ